MRSGLRLEAMARMSDVAAHPDVRAHWPVISQALLASASPQVRNMGTIGGNLLQRTRCGYFRDTGFACNKREPGSGCPAIAGENRMLAILGGSDHCIATHASDLAVALTALDAVLELRGPDGAQRHVPIADFYRLPGDTPHIETVLAARRDDHRCHGPRQRGGAELALSEGARSRELRVRAGLGCRRRWRSRDGTVHDVRVAAGGVGTRPWRLPEVETALRGKHAERCHVARSIRAGRRRARVRRRRMDSSRSCCARAVLRALQTVSA